MPLDRKKATAIPGGGGGWLNGKDTESSSKFHDCGAKVFGTAGNASEQTGTSIFDPLLCELVYRWFCPPGGIVLDPFAGGSVRGIVAAMLGRKYVGVDLSERQFAANKAQWSNIKEHQAQKPDTDPTWLVGDSQTIDEICKDIKADLLFSCPPYADLEVYSYDKQDLSTMDYPQFLEAYRKIIAKSCAMLAEDRFACFVVGEVRGKDGNYYGFIPDTINAFVDCGLKYYNEAILVTAIGSLPIRIGRQFEGSRKLGKTHQNVLVFVKGDAKKATSACGKVDVSFLDELQTVLAEVPHV